MKLVELKCSHCGAALKVKADTTHIDCRFCGASYELDDEVERIQVEYENAAEAGYEFERGRQQAIKEKAYQEHLAQEEAAERRERRKTLIMLWIVLFPVMLTIWVWTKTKLHIAFKILITVAIIAAIVGIRLALLAYIESAK